MNMTHIHKIFSKIPTSVRFQVGRQITESIDKLFEISQPEAKR
jgi:hypothetical protein